MVVPYAPPRGKAAVAWLVPWVGVIVMLFVCPPLEDGIGFSRSSAIALIVGVPLGLIWYRLYPRALARRLVALLILLGLWVLIVGFADQLDSELPGSVVFTFLGIVVGLAVLEVRASRRQSSTSTETRTCSTLQDEPLCKVCCRSTLTS